MINKEFGGSVIKKETREDGQYVVEIVPQSSLFKYSINMTHNFRESC